MRPEDLYERHAALFHVTFATAWRGIMRNGLWSAEELTRLLGWPNERRERFLARRRLRVGSYDDSALGRVTFRDHAAIPRSGLGDALHDMTEAQWYRELNRRVFFYPQAEGAKGLIAAYSDQQQVTIAVDTKRLLTTCAGCVTVSTINTGYGMRQPARRGSDTFVPLTEFPRDLLSSIAEITVEDGIENIAELVVAVCAPGGETCPTLWPDPV